MVPFFFCVLLISGALGTKEDQFQIWQRTVESILTQFALASFPKEFTPAIFEEGRVNASVVLNQQRTTLRSLVYHRALSTLGSDPLLIRVPEGIAQEATDAVVEELRERGFSAYRLNDRRLFFSKVK